MSQFCDSFYKLFSYIKPYCHSQNTNIWNILLVKWRLHYSRPWNKYLKNAFLKAGIWQQLIGPRECNGCLYEKSVILKRNVIKSWKQWSYKRNSYGRNYFGWHNYMFPSKLIIIWVTFLKIELLFHQILKKNYLKVFMVYILNSYHLLKW